jgi:hypothetical protein
MMTTVMSAYRSSEVIQAVLDRSERRAPIGRHLTRRAPEAVRDLERLPGLGVAMLRKQGWGCANCGNCGNRGKREDLRSLRSFRRAIIE